MPGTVQLLAGYATVTLRPFGTIFPRPASSTSKLRPPPFSGGSQEAKNGTLGPPRRSVQVIDQPQHDEDCPPIDDDFDSTSDPDSLFDSSDDEADTASDADSETPLEEVGNDTDDDDSLFEGEVRQPPEILDRAVIFLAWGVWLGTVFMITWPPDRPSGPAADGDTSWSQETWRGRVLYAIVFSPVGCISRFYASVHLNGISASFPIGTFVVNMFGTIVLGVSWDLQRAPLEAGQIGGVAGCQVLQSVQDGLSGCLTTVSKWVLELSSLKRRHAYFYGAMSVGVALATLVAIMGSLSWTRGFLEPACSI
ncbi:uncharacterized protein BP5553_04734 [Venustampulla echinocandica]|uniref:Fluoride ion transporter CrcB n=1 Tax=Venustampulla echinocandica TaxID=2656787 RepID=A0A370TP50_9HELO|nr:uncharacterized protein BP5553_04734 [Venustampulla echinocandica]RDL37301.1 hypothetical protein BP5553_04734 [Venustampulla echinocandica]